MGASPYFYFVDYEEDIQNALDRLRQREFRAGRYYPVAACLDFPVTDDSPSPGPKHSSIEEALNSSGPEGTCSILDLERVVDTPYDDDEDSESYGVAFPIADETLIEILGSTRPSPSELEVLLFDLIEDVARGTGIYVVAYCKDTPTTLLFAGYSYD